jgi:peptidylprolyl isomerase
MRNVEKLIILLLIAVAVAIPACSQKETKTVTETRQAIPENGKSVTTASGLIYTDLVVGTGPSPIAGKQVKVHYTGWLENGTKFDSSLDHGQPFAFTIGAGQVIPGWDEGVMTMKTGGKRKLVIPPQLGYGSAGAGGVIPPDATLIFEVELLDAAQ